MQQRTRLLYEVYTDEYEKLGGCSDTEDIFSSEIKIDVEPTFDRMENRRYVQVLKWVLVDGYDADDVARFMNASVYNIKHRAIVQFVETYNR